jgi:hypothetical protein
MPPPGGKRYMIVRDRRTARDLRRLAPVIFEPGAAARFLVGALQAEQDEDAGFFEEVEREAPEVIASITCLETMKARWQIEHPTGGTVTIIAQYGVYLLFSTSFVPLACGMFLPFVARRVVAAAVAASVAAYVSVAVFRLTMLHNNPAFLATAAILAGWAVIGGSLLAVLVRRGFSRR